MIFKRGSGEMILVVGVTLLAVLVGIALWSQGFKFFNSISTGDDGSSEQEIEEYKASFDFLIDSVVSVLNSEKISAGVAEIDLREDMALLFFDRNSNIIKAKTLEDRNKFEINVERPEECGERIPCVALCHFLALKDLKEEDDKKIINLACANVLSYDVIGFEKFVNKEKIILRVDEVTYRGPERNYGGPLYVPSERVNQVFVDAYFEEGVFIGRRLRPSTDVVIAQSQFFADFMKVDFGIVHFKKEEGDLLICSSKNCGEENA